MIAKLHPPHDNLASTLRYNFKKVESGEARVLYTRGLNFRSNDEVNYSETKSRMYGTLPEDYRTKNIVFHASINPHKDDNMSDATMEFFIDEYMEALGYGGQPYVVFKHDDIDRTHYHVVSLNVDRKGKKIDDRFIKKKSWKILQELSKKYGIKLPGQHLKEERNELLQSPPSPIIYREGNLVEKIKEAVDYAMELYKPKSIGELSAILIGYNIGIDPISKRDSTDGEEGLVYSVIDEQNNRVSTGINASDLGFYYLRKQLEAQFKENKKSWKKERANRIKYAVAWATRNTKNPITFVSNMREMGVNVLLRFNKEGRIYGVTYIDTKMGNVCNGSDIGKEYSANTLEDYFTGQSTHLWSLNIDRAQHIERAISQTLKEDLSLEEFVQSMNDKGVETMVEKDGSGQIINFVFADHKHYALISSNEMRDHYSTILLQNYFQEGGVNFWFDDSHNLTIERTLYAEEQERRNNQKSYSEDESLLDDIIDSVGNSAGSNKALAIGRMYQRQAERNWGKTRRR